MITLLADSNNLGDPDTWPEAAVWIVAIVAGAFVVWIYAKYIHGNDAPIGYEEVTRRKLTAEAEAEVHRWTDK